MLNRSIAISGVRVEGPDPGPHGTLSYRLHSPYQTEPTLLRVVLPQEATSKRVIFVLPVFAGPGPHESVGDEIKTLIDLDACQRFGCALAFPTFSAIPWYADHPTLPGVRQESHFLNVVVPLMEQLHPHQPMQRGLLGFSKSGWGAWSLLLRHPDRFAAAVAWDAPLACDQIGVWGRADIFGSEANFRVYRVHGLLEKSADALRNSPTRFALHGYGNFRDFHLQTHRLLDDLHIPHDYRDGPFRAHRWDSGWVEDALASLCRMLV